MVNGNLPDGWATTTLAEASEVVLGQSPTSDTYNTDGSGLPFYQGKAEFGDLYPTTVKWCSDPGKIAEAGDILISVRASVGPTNLCQEKSCIGRGLAALRPKGGMPTKYLLYYLRLIEKEWDSKATGTTFKAITGDVLRHQEIPIAPLPEQERIVAKIEELFTQLEAGTAALKRVRAGLKRYKASVLKAAVEGLLPSGRSGAMPIPSEGELPDDWRWVKIDAFLDHKRGAMKTGPFGSFLKKHEHQEAGVPLVGIENIKNMEFVFGSKIHITKEKAAQLAGYDLCPEDIVISRSGTVGEVTVIPENLGEARMSTNIMRVCLDKSVMLPKFFTFLFNGSPAVLDQISELCKGSTRDFLNQHILKSITFPLPPLAEQRRIVAEVERRLEGAQEVESVVAAALARASRLRQAILKNAFGGKLS